MGWRRQPDPDVVSASLLVDYFDGQRSEPQLAFLSIRRSQVEIRQGMGQQLLRRLPLRDIHWPERTQHGARIAQLSGGGSVQAKKVGAWDVWVEQYVHHHRRPWQSHWATVALAGVVTLVLLTLAYVEGLPWMAGQLTRWVPADIERAFGGAAMAQIDGHWLHPSRLPEAEQDRLRRLVDHAVQQAYGLHAPTYQLQFRQSASGPNAFALPGGTLVVTDELIELFHDDAIVLGVLGHELGHVAQRHGVRQVVQVALLQTLLAVSFGDFTSLTTTAPLIVGSLAYSRDNERQADLAAIDFLRANQRSPQVMVQFLDTLRQHGLQTQRVPLDIAIISSHPPDDERLALFAQAANGH